MELFMLTTIVFLLGFVFGGHAMLLIVRKVLKRMAQSESPQVPHNFLVKEVPSLTTERISGVILLYEKTMFLCQGTSIEEVAKNFALVPGVAKVAQVRHDDKSIWFIDGEVNESLDQV